MSEPQIPGVNGRNSLAFLGIWCSQTVLLSLACLPLERFVAQSGVAHFPARDALLFQAGGLYLAEILRISPFALLGALQSSSILFAVSCIVAVFLVNLWLAILAAPLQLGSAISAALGRFPGSLFAGGIVFVAQAITLLVCLLVRDALHQSELATSDPRSLTCLSLAVMGLGLVSCQGLALWLDLARGFLTRASHSGGQALFAAFRLFHSHFWRIGASWLKCNFLGVLLLLGVGLIGAKFEAESTALYTTALVLLCRQIALIFSFYQRQLWLMHVLELTQRDPG